MAIVGIGSVEAISLHNTSVTIDSHGAKVLSILVGERELLFYDENDIGHSGIPLCFPSFGPLKNKQFVFEGIAYPMSQHGFIRDSLFTMKKSDSSTLVCSFESNEETLVHYPFDFLFVVTYQVVEEGLSMRFQFTNRDTKSLPLAPGVHPYFAVKDFSKVTMSTGATLMNDNLDGFREKSVEDSSALQVLQELDNGIREVGIIGTPDVHLIGHNLDTTLVATGHEYGIVLENDSSVFNRMTVWRKTEQELYICVEPAYVQNGLNDMPLMVASGETWDTAVSVALNR